METSNLLIIGIIIAAILLIWIVYKNVMQDEKFIETEEYFIDNNESLVEWCFHPDGSNLVTRSFRIRGDQQ